MKVLKTKDRLIDRDLVFFEGTVTDEQITKWVNDNLTHDKLELPKDRLIAELVGLRTIEVFYLAGQDIAASFEIDVVRYVSLKEIQ